jgi:hypothetical protein
MAPGVLLLLLLLLRIFLLLLRTPLQPAHLLG